MDGNPADWEACSRESQMTPSQASRRAVEMVLNDLKHQQEQASTEPEMEGKRLAKRPRVDPDPSSYDYNLGFTNVPTRARPHNTPSSHRNTSTLGSSTNTTAGPSMPTPAYEKCRNCGTFSLPADNPALERTCKDCGQLFFPSQTLAHETRAYAQPTSPYAPLPATNPLAFPSLLPQTGLSPLGFPRAAPILTRPTWVFHNGKDWLINDFRQPIDAAGELVDFDFYLIDAITKVRRLDLFGREMHGRVYPEQRKDSVPAPVDTNSHS